ncbi:MAG: hypothetical protein IT366_02040 [Candidatus Hydrogenedentes bacterium]|nr:hypothetical protein [Candidatus Hydrogenedentota bacterium]
MANGTLRLSVNESSSAVKAARAHITDLDGRVVKVTEYPWWHDHFVFPGTAIVALSEGDYCVVVERGPEYVPGSAEFSIRPDSETNVQVEISRFVDMPGHGWWPGDLHVHRPPENIELLMRAEDLHVAPVITWWNNKNYWANRPIPEHALVQFDGNRFYDVMAGEDERNGGAFLYYGELAPIDLLHCDKEYPSPLSISMASKKSGDNWIDIEKPFWWDVSAALALGFCSSIGIANNHMCRSSMYEGEAWGKPRDVARLPAPRGNGYWSQEIYYEILNAGIRIPPSAGSASGVLPNPVGYNRVYVQIDPQRDGKLSWETWWDGLRSGRSFVTNGPMLIVKANGELPGHVFQSTGPIDISLSAEILTQENIPYVEVIKNGAINHTVPFNDFKRSGSLGTLQFEESGWFIVRAVTDNSKTFRFASTAPFYVETGKQNMRISRASAQFFLDWVRERIARIKHDDPEKLMEILRHHHEAEKFWRRQVKHANAP